MAKICIKCGGILDDNARYCSHCGADQLPQPTPRPMNGSGANGANTPFFTPPAESAQPYRDQYAGNYRRDAAYNGSRASGYPQQRVSIPAWESVPGSSSVAPVPQKKSKAVGIVLVVCLIAVLATVTALFIIPAIGDRSEPEVLFKKSGASCYLSPYVYKLDGEDAVSMSFEEGKNEYYFTELDPSSSVYVKNCLYVIGGSKDEIFSNGLSLYRFSDDKLIKEMWVSPRTLSDSFLNTSDDDDTAWAAFMYSPQTDGEYIYFTIVPSGSDQMDHLDIAYRMGRISLDGETIEEIKDVRAGSFVVNDGWIYYYDNGFKYEDEEYGIDASRIGIYKIKPDGSSKRSIKKLSDPAMETLAFDGLAPVFCDEMKIAGDKLYFLDYTPKGRGRVCRMNRNGSDMEYVSYSSAQRYTVDEKNETVYYTKGNYSSSAAMPSDNDDNSKELLRFEIPSEKDKKEREKEKEDDDKDDEDKEDKKDKGDKDDEDESKKDESKLCDIPVSNARLSYNDGYLYFYCSGFDFGDGEKAKAGMRVDAESGKLQYLVSYHLDSGKSAGAKEKYRDDNNNIVYWVNENDY